MGFSYVHAEVYGDNEIAFYNGEFNQINAHTRVNIAKLRPDLTVYAKLRIELYRTSLIEHSLERKKCT